MPQILLNTPQPNPTPSSLMQRVPSAEEQHVTRMTLEVDAVIIQGCPMGGGPNWHLLLKNKFKAGDVARLVEDLLSMHKSLSSIPSTA